MQLVGTGEDDVEKISLTELAEPWQIHPEGSNSRLWHGLKLQRHIPAQVFVVTLPAFPISVQLVPLVYHSQKIRFRPGCFLQPPHSLCANFPLEPFFAGGRGFLFLVLQLGGIVSGMLVLLQLAFQLQRAFLCKRFLQRFVLRRTVRRILPIGKAILIHFKVGFLYLLLGIFFLIGKIIIPQQFILPWFHDSFTSSKKYFSFSQKTVPIYTPFFSY